MDATGCLVCGKNAEEHVYVDGQRVYLCDAHMFAWDQGEIGDEQLIAALLKSRPQAKQTLPVGTQVSWQSQANGTYVEKRGKIIAFVDASELVMLPPRVLRSHFKGELFSTRPRYLVAVPRGGKSKITDYYAPLASVIHRYNKPEGAE
jgi:hypothetical protein